MFKRTTVLLSTVCFSLCIQAATYYVNASRPDDSGPGTSWETAKQTIQGAVNLTTSGDTILVTNGVYNVGATVTPGYSLNNRVVITNAIIVKSMNGAESTIIEGSGTEFFGTPSAIRCVYMSKGLLDGFTLRKGATQAYPAYQNGFDHNGGGIIMSGTSSGAELRNSVVESCKATSGGGAARGNVVNCLFWKNEVVQHGGATYDCIIVHSALFDNKAGAGGGGSAIDVAVNSIIWGNKLSSGIINDWQSSFVATSHTTVDPLFVDAVNGNFRLQPSSPCKDAGVNAFVLSLTDLDGNPRIQNGIVDMGPYEIEAAVSNTPNATIYYVDVSRPDDSGIGTSWSTAKKSIQAAVNQAVAGDIVLVSNGVYNTGVTITPNYSSNNRLVITNDITVKSVNGADVTIIEGSGIEYYGTDSAVRCVYMSKGVLDGFTLTKGTTLAYPSYQDGHDHRGGGILMEGTLSGAVLKNSVVASCKATAGGGAASGNVVNCLFWKNTVDRHGGATYACLIANSTLTGNQAALGGGGSVIDGAINCIIWGNRLSSGAVNNMQDSVASSSNITADPFFVDAANGDFRLQPSSPCRDAGDNAMVLTLLDLDGKPRINNGTVDMGAYEYGATITVTFDAQGGMVTPESKIVGINDIYGELPIPTREGYTFSQWLAVTGGISVVVTPDTVVLVATNHTLTASWAVNTYTATFDPTGGTVSPANKIVTFNAVYGELPMPARTGYTFEGWQATTNGIVFGVTSNSVVSIPSDHTLAASWSANTYTATFNPEGGEVNPTNKVVTFNAIYGELPMPSRTGYTFTGWQTSTNGVIFGVTAATAVSIASDHTLTASWTANTYTVTFNPQGGEVNPIAKTVTFDSAYGDLPMPACNGYIFAGWWTGVLGSGTQVTALTVVTADADHALYANWTDDPYLCPPADTEELSSVGSYDGFFFSENDFSDYTATAVRGTLTLKVTSPTGRLTAKVVTQTGSLRFSAKAWSETEEDGTFLAKLETRGGEALDLHVSQNRVWGKLTGGEFGNEILTLDGARNRFADSKDVEAQTLLNGYRGYYTVALPVADSLSLGSADAAPRGAGYLTITVANRGAVKIAGMLADGTKVSQSSRLILFDSCGPEACVPFFVPLYSRTGWTGGLLWIDPADKTVVTDRYLGWFIRWEKPGAGPDGFSELLDSCGGFYDTTSALEANYRFSAETNALSYHFNGGIAELQTAALPSGLSVTRNGTRLAVTRGTIPLLADGAYDYSAENSAMTTLSFTSRTGIFKGTFSLYYDYTLNGRLIHKTLRVPYAGVLTPVQGNLFSESRVMGQGFYLVPDNNPLWRPIIKRSYRITLSETP